MLVRLSVSAEVPCLSQPEVNTKTRCRSERVRLSAPVVVSLPPQSELNSNTPDLPRLKAVLAANRHKFIKTITTTPLSASRPGLPLTMSTLDKQLVDASREGNVARVTELLEKGANPNKRDKYGMSVLMEAAEEGNLQIVKVLLDKGADPNLKDKLGLTTMHFAVEEGHAAIIHTLLHVHAEFFNHYSDVPRALAGR